MSRTRLQRDFFAGIADVSAFRSLFDHLPDVFFFAKDRESRLIAGNRSLLERVGLRKEADIVGCTDYDFVGRSLAEGFRADDEFVLRTGKPLIDRLEVWFDEQRNLDWFLTTKVPFRDRNGKIAGIIGTIRRDTSHASDRPESAISRVTDYLREHTGGILTTAKLARECGLSERTLYRKLNESLSVTPYELMLRIRIQKAAEALLKTGDKVIVIALAHGFCSQSSFTQHFRKRMGMTPKQFRLRHHG
ncbi:MAG: AraC family transcriptional regulator [Chthoniobacteraceae bacterium]